MSISAISEYVIFFRDIYSKFLPISIIMNTVGGIFDGIEIYNKNQYNFSNPPNYMMCVVGGGFMGMIYGFAFPLLVPYSVGHYLYNKFYVKKL